jgi:hypothetical protein
VKYRLLSRLDSGVVRTNFIENFIEAEHELECQECVARDQQMILSKEPGKRGGQVMEPDVEEVHNSLETV